MGINIGQKKIDTVLSNFQDDIDKSLLQDIFKEEQIEIQKGKAVPIGTVRTKGDRSYIKTADGWKYKAKGGEKKSSESKDVEHKLTIKEGSQVREGAGGKLGRVVEIRGNSVRTSESGSNFIHVSKLFDKNSESVIAKESGSDSKTTIADHIKVGPQLTFEEAKSKVPTAYANRDYLGANITMKDNIAHFSFSKTVGGGGGSHDPNSYVVHDRKAVHEAREGLFNEHLQKTINLFKEGKSHYMTGSWDGIEDAGFDKETGKGFIVFKSPLKKADDNELSQAYKALGL